MIHKYCKILTLAVVLLSTFFPVSSFAQKYNFMKEMSKVLSSVYEHEQQVRDSLQNELAKEGIAVINHESYKVLEDNKRHQKIVIEKKDTGNRDASGSAIYAIYCDNRFIKSGISVADLIDAISIGLSYSDWGKSVPDRIVRDAAKLLAY